MWPRPTTGRMPMLRPSARTPRARPGIILLEKSGASRKSGETRARTRKNPATCCSEKRARSSLGSIVAGADGLEVDERGDVAPEAAGPVDDRAEHPRPGDRDHGDEAEDLRDEGERLLLDLGDGLQHRDHEADDE